MLDLLALVNLVKLCKPFEILKTLYKSEFLKKFLLLVFVRRFFLFISLYLISLMKIWIMKISTPLIGTKIISTADHAIDIIRDIDIHHLISFNTSQSNYSKSSTSIYILLYTKTSLLPIFYSLLYLRKDLIHNHMLLFG